MSDAEQRVLRVRDAYTAAVAAKDADAFIHLYEPDVTVFDAWGTWAYEGASAWRVAVEGWFSSLAAETVRVRFDDVTISGDRDVASMSAIVTYAAVSARGEDLREMQNRISWFLRASDDGLRIAHEHTSAPIGFEDLRAILRREGGT